MSDFEIKLQQLAEQNGWAMEQPKSVQHGVQVVVRSGGQKVSVTRFSTGKITVQGGAGDLKDRLVEWASSGMAVLAPSTVTLDSPSKLNFDATYQFSGDDPNELIGAFTNINATFREENVSSDYQLRIWELKRDGARLKATLYRTQKLHVQGARTLLALELDRELEEITKRSVEERALSTAVNQAQKEAIVDYSSNSQATGDVARWITDHFSAEVLEFLPERERHNYESGVFTFLTATQHPDRYKDSTNVVMPFARAFEGFLLKFFACTGDLTEEKLKGNLAGVRAGNLLEQFFTKREKEKSWQVKGWQHAVLSAWREVRNKVMHADPTDTPCVPSPASALMDIMALNKAMFEAYTYLAKEGLAEKPAVRPTALNSKPKNALPEIGADESGKGDFFGPLVVAAVYGNQEIRQRLERLGVRESKQLTSRRLIDLRELSAAIRQITETAVKVSEPLEYNRENPPGAGRLNDFMTEMHLQNVQSLVVRTQARSMLLDQFDQTREGKTEKRFRAALPEVAFTARTKADSTDVLVAAASILALTEQREWFERIRAETGVTLFLGSSSESKFAHNIEKLQQVLLELDLWQFAKIHHSTTSKVEQLLGIAVPRQHL